MERQPLALKEKSRNESESLPMESLPELIYKVTKALLPLLSGLLSTGYCHAQWTKQDSLRLKELLEKEGEIELNPEAIRSIGTGSHGRNGTGSSESALPNTPPLLYRQPFGFNHTLPTPPFPQSKADTLMKQLRMSLQFYTGSDPTLLNPETRRSLQTNDVLNEKALGIPHLRMTPGLIGPMNDARLLMMGGGIGGSFKYDLNRFFSQQFWDFRQRRNTRKTLAALSAYDAPEQQSGCYEYFHIDNEEYRLDFAGNDSIRPCVEKQLQESRPVEKGLLYFLYTGMCRGKFTYFFPDGNDVSGTFTTNGTRYTLCYGNGREVVITLTRTGGRLFTLRRDLTGQYRNSYTTQEVKKVQVVSTVTQIAKGKDR